jgi:hypothetical protein
MSLNEKWKDKVDGVDGIMADDVNSIAHAVIEIEKNGASGDEIVVDDIMSDVSKNPVQNKVIKNYVDSTKTDLQKYLDEQILGGAW